MNLSNKRYYVTNPLTNKKDFIRFKGEDVKETLMKIERRLLTIPHHEWDEADPYEIWLNRQIVDIIKEEAGKELI